MFPENILFSCLSLRHGSAKKEYLPETGYVNFKHRNMAIKPTCDKCKKELNTYGAILLSPPDRKSKVKKFHLCESCYKEIKKQLKNKQ